LSAKTMEIQYRCATVSDVPLLARMHRQSVEDECGKPYPSLSECEAEIERCLGGKGEAILFQVGGADVGYTLFQREPEGIFLRHFFVCREHRRQGIGRTAIQWLITEAWQRPARVRLVVHVKNAAGHTFWRVVGFSDWLIDMKMESKGVAQAPAPADADKPHG